MDVYVLPSNRAEDFNRLMLSLKVSPNMTKEKILKTGLFTNFYPPILYFCRRIERPDKYEISFGINISSKTLKIKSAEIIDENFGQPCFCDDIDYEFIRKMVDMLIEHGVLVVDDEADDRQC